MFSGLKDEYGEMDSSGSIFKAPNYTLDSGDVLEDCQMCYQTYGELNQARDNCVVVCHALTGNASLDVWWQGLLGTNQPLDTSRYFVVCCNILGSCYGSTSPMSMNPQTRKPYGIDFPSITVKDTVRLQLLLLQEELKVNSIRSVIGGSFGGMQAVEFMVQGGDYLKSAVPMACGARHTAWQIAISQVQRNAIYADPAWQAGSYAQATQGLALARQMGMISYRTAGGYQQKFGRETNDKGQWQVSSYLDYQGEKFLDRFDPITYVKLTEQMDTHDAADQLKNVDIPALVLGIDSDVLYPLEEQEQLTKLIPNAEMKVIHSTEGHDGFLLEQEQVGGFLTEFLNNRI